MSLIPTTLLLSLLTTSPASSDVRIEDLYGRWCLRSLAATIDGERVPDNSSYEFTQQGRLNYQMGPYTQSGDYTVDGDRIETTGMGNYDIVTLDKTRMTLHYVTFFFFEKGSCD